MPFLQYRLQQYGASGLVLESAAERSPGPGEVLLRVQAVALNHRDLSIMQGQYAPRVRLPLIPCSDACGLIEAVGPGVEHIGVGARVITRFFPSWRSGIPEPEALAVSLGCEIDGVLTQSAILPASAVMPAPAYLSDEEAATLPCTGVTAWSALFVETCTAPCSRVLVQGTGGVALFGLQLASAAGAEVIVISSSDAKLTRARALGAAHLINYSTTPDWAAKVNEITAAKGVDTVIELGGSATLRQSLRCLSLGGSVCVVGMLSGPQAELGILDVLYHRARVIGITVGSGHDQAQLCAALSRHGIHPVIDQTFAFDRVGEALAYLASGRHFGKVIVRC